MRDASGARVYELGWGGVQLRAAGEGVLAGLPNELAVLHWHGDAFDFPTGAVALASSAACAGQAFRLRERLFAFQFHCEASAADVDIFLREDSEFAIKARGPDAVAVVRRETAEHSGTSALRDRLIENVLDAMLPER
jgi:GMP synthase (glutamine-hydrolysing)